MPHLGRCGWTETTLWPQQCQTSMYCTLTPARCLQSRVLDMGSIVASAQPH